MGVVYETLRFSAQKTEKRGRDSQPYVEDMYCYSTFRHDVFRTSCQF